MVIQQIVEDAFNNPASVSYGFSIPTNTINAIVPANGSLDFYIKFKHTGGTAGAQGFSGTWHLVYAETSVPLIIVSNAARNFEVFRGNTTFNLDSRVSALDDIDGDITAQITKTCTNRSSGQAVACPNNWSDLPRGDYVFSYGVVNSSGIAAAPVDISVALWDLMKMDGGTYHAVVVGSNGDLYTWGYNAGYRLGLGDTDRRPSPVKMAISSAEIVDAAACNNSGHAVDISGNLYSWGSNSNYVLGIGTSSAQQTPYQIKPPSDEKYTQVSCFYNTSAALTDKGNVYTWGWEGYGVSGHGDTGDKQTPTRLPELSNIVYIDMGYFNGGAIDSNGNLWEWGTNGEGQLGVGSTGAVPARSVTAYFNKPATYNNITDVKAVCFGVYHAILIKNDGTVLTWGNNAYGRIGNGSPGTTNSYTPYTTNITTGVSCSAHRYGSAVATTDGLGYFTGSNDFGELGQGSASPSLYSFTPTNKTGISGIALQTDSGHTLANGTLVWSSGYNGNGELGIGTTTSTPIVTAWNLAPPAVVEW
jgi:alpha-tubulin suppressor-like RCC1 family protein